MPTGFLVLAPGRHSRPESEHNLREGSEGQAPVGHRHLHRRLRCCLCPDALWLLQRLAEEACWSHFRNERHSSAAAPAAGLPHFCTQWHQVKTLVGGWDQLLLQGRILVLLKHLDRP